MNFTYKKQDFLIGTSKALSLIFGAVALLGVIWTAFDFYAVILAITFLISALCPDRIYKQKNIKFIFYALTIIAIAVNLSYSVSDIKHDVPVIVELVSGRTLMTLVLLSYLWRVYRANLVGEKNNKTISDIVN